MSDSQIHTINFAEVSRSEDLHTDICQGLKLIELSLFGIQAPDRGPIVDRDDLAPIAGFVMEMQEKFEQYADAMSKICQEQPAQIGQAKHTGAARKGATDGQR
jgi:hypothetical protein